jgi:hypothetical protein
MLKDLCGLKLLVQFTVDGFKVKRERLGEVSSGRADNSSNVHGDVDYLIRTLRDLNANKGLPSERSQDDISIQPLLKIIPHRGLQARQDELVEMKTVLKTSRRSNKESHLYEQAILGQTPTTVYGMHVDGLFDEEKVFTLEEWGDDEKMSSVRERVQKMAGLLKQIIESIGVEPAGTRYCLVQQKGGEGMVLSKGGRGVGLMENRSYKVRN